MIYLIAGYENFCVYTATGSPLIANALIGSSIDAYTRLLTPHHAKEYELAKDPNFFYKNVIKVSARGDMQLSTLANTEISEQWLENRKILQRRRQLFTIWENYITGALVRVQRYKWEGFTSIASTELNLCNIENNQYTIMIEEYARAVELPVELAYKDLKQRVESDNITKFRLTALAEKWKYKINQTSTDSEFQLIVPEMTQEFQGNSFV